MERWREERNARWRHCGLVGQVRFAIVVCESAMSCETASDEAKTKARVVHTKLYELLELLKERKMLP